MSNSDSSESSTAKGPPPLRIADGQGRSAPPDALESASRATRVFYEQNAENYADETLSTDLAPLWSAFEAQIRPEARIADLGCGGGRDLRRFAKRFRPIGLDLSFALSRIAREVSNAPIVVGDLMALPFRDSAFEGAWLSASLLHFPTHLVGHALTEVHRVVQPGGVALMTFKEGQGTTVDTRGRYVTLYSHSSAEALLYAAGFLTSRVIRTVERRGSGDVSWLAYLARRP